MYVYDFRPKKRGINRELIFVAMPFDKKYDNILNELINPATEKANDKLSEEGLKFPELKAYRTKDDIRMTSGWINILEHLLTAQIVLGVLTSDNPNVFYELGIAHATQPKTRQILIANKGYEPRFNLKDLIFYEYDESRLDSDIEPLAERIADAIKTYKIEEEKKVFKARMRVGPYGFDVMMNHGIDRHFAFKGTEEAKKDYEDKFGKGSHNRHIQGITNLCEFDLLALSTVSRRDTDGMVYVEFSYWWTGLGNEVLNLLKLIDDETLWYRNTRLPDFF